MAISTSGVSVPQVSTNYDSSIYGNKDMPKGMTIADMLDINKKQLDLQKATETYAFEVSKVKAESEKAQTGSEKSKAELQNYYQTSAQGAISALQKKISSLKTPDGKFVDGAQHILKNDADMVEQILLAQGVPRPPNDTMEQFKNAIAQGPDKAENFINVLTQKGGSAESRFTQANPTLTSVGGVPGFATPATQQFTPLNIGQNQPTGGTTGGTNAPAQTTEQPEKVVKETFPNRPNTPYVSDTEKPKFEEGTKTLADARTLGDSAKTQLNDIRNVRKYIKSTSGTALGQGSRTVAKLIAENPDFDSLIKSTAQLQLNAAGQLNSNTDAARALLAATTGDGGNISEKALARLLDTAEADLLAASKYSSGIQNFAKKRGVVGGPLNAPDFKQAWTENAKDRKLYQLININSNPEFSAAQKTLMRDELLSKESPESIKELQKQMKAMKRLEQGD